MQSIYIFLNCFLSFVGKYPPEFQISLLGKNKFFRSFCIFQLKNHFLIFQKLLNIFTYATFLNLRNGTLLNYPVDRKLLVVSGCSNENIMMTRALVSSQFVKFRELLGIREIIELVWQASEVSVLDWTTDNRNCRLRVICPGSQI